jgi:alpha-tubulin suppressor-like RCC1 family protein
MPDMSTPVTALGADVAEVSVGMYAICARKKDGTLWCWGDNSSGAFGNGTNVSSGTPVQIHGA